MTYEGRVIAGGSFAQKLEQIFGHVDQLLDVCAVSYVVEWVP